MARPRLRYLLPAIVLLVSACSGTTGTPPSSAAAAVTGGASASASTTPSSGSAAPSGSVASIGPAVASTAPAPTRTTPPAPTARATPVPATRPPATPAPSATAVKIVDFGFSPDAITVRVGTTVRWTNTGQADHTVTADAGAFGSGTLAPGASFSVTFRTAGTFAYHCAIHPFMKGTITVTG